MDPNYRTVVPVGYVFRPEPEELLWFLREKITLQDQWVQPPEIKTLDLYDNDSNPWMILDPSSDQPSYVITRLKKVGPGQSRVKRTAGVGTWKEQQSSDVTFRRQDGVENLKGVKRYFVFQAKKGSGYSRDKHGHWIMSEYSIVQDGVVLSDCVVCEIHNKDSSRTPSSCKRKLVVYDRGDDTKRMRSSTLRSTVKDEVADQDHDDDGSFRELVDLLNSNVERVDQDPSSSSDDHDRSSVVTSVNASGGPESSPAPAEAAPCDEDTRGAHLDGSYDWIWDGLDLDDIEFI